MVRDDINQSSGSFKVVVPVFEGCIDRCEFLVMDVIVLLCLIKGLGEEHHWVKITVGSPYGQHSYQGIVRCIGLYHDRSIRNPVHEHRSCCECLFESVEGGPALSVRIFPYPTGQSKMTKCLLERPSGSWLRYIYICVRQVS